MFSLISLHICEVVLKVPRPYSEIFAKLIFFKMGDTCMITFPTNHPWWKKCRYVQTMYLICKQFEKQCECYLLFYKWWKPYFLISKRAFPWFLLNYTDFAHEISHIKPSNMTQLLEPKSPYVWKKFGMRLFIRTSTFNIILFFLFSPIAHLY